MTYKDLIVWQKAHANGIATIRALDTLRPSRSTDITARQLLRAVLAIGANIAEGYGRHGGKEYERFLEIAYGSANEADNWLTVFLDTGLMQTELARDLQARNEEVLRILAAMLRTLREKRLRPGGSPKETEGLYKTAESVED
ncbi:MAG: four helix bundle protein [Dehalococcoidia bacterium]|nr:four helix bundle protein [Dehalococcoidia bacterium]